MAKKLTLLFLIIITTSRINAQWTELGGTSGLQANSYINSVCSDSTGNIYTAGDFSDGAGYHYVAKWNGAGWNELGTGINALNANLDIYCTCTDASGNLYAAGYFRNTNNNCYVAKWNGTTWNELAGTDSLKANSDFQSICTDNQGMSMYPVHLLTAAVKTT
jgi:hypothetical protein